MKKRMIWMIAIIVVLAIVACFVIKFIKNVKDDKKTVEDNITVINDSYNKIKYEVTNYNKLREDISNFINDFYYENVEEKYSSNMELLGKYDEVVNKITSEVKILDTKCNISYTDKEITNICNNYKNDYEIIVNVFINDINKYNNKLNNYNNDLDKNKELFKSKYINDYIDYNNDNKYEKKEEVNE